MVYPIDPYCRRWLSVGRRRNQATLRRGLTALGSEVVVGLKFVCADTWHTVSAGHGPRLEPRKTVMQSIESTIDWTAPSRGPIFS